jgi:hypothetical protein
MERDYIAPKFMKLEKQMVHPHEQKQNNGRICKPGSDCC